MGTRAFIALGSNLAHPRRQIAAALDALRHTRGIRVLAVSPNYVTAPVGGPRQPDYVNAVAEIETTLSPRALLAQMQRIERRRGRVRDRASRNAPRTLDLDLLLYGALRMRTPNLIVPHPRMHERAFVLRPLADVAPAQTIPGRGLARRFLPDVRAQRIARTRTHHR
ncbi:MAG TPA: 2-amino-4-hydroxy-6-hydroxymethyldihydropteridine diphosphokinase [Casimicrobiaceae bacterium]|nr:2-amino-4-hydroxy-6-hydroxymethyldihydropteridine diphosphokinase [Casimicrobiaceae bacterium]